MLTMLKRFFFAVALMITAQSASFAAEKSAAFGNAETGKAKAAACSGCHGMGGNSAVAAYPRLAGQSAPYIVAQLQAFKSGQRVNPIMQAQSAALSDQDMKDIAAYFSAQKRGYGTAKATTAKTIAKLYRNGDAQRGIPACAACHGQSGKGNSASGYAYIGGQHEGYTASRLNAYRTSIATSDNAKMMSEVAKKLTDEEITALANYLQGLH